MGDPIIAIIGRPNVGKSRLFNRLLGQRKAIVEDIPGITRDRNYGQCEFLGCSLKVVDTGGLDLRPEGKLLSGVMAQTRHALEESDLLLFLMDGREGLTPADQEIVQLLRKSTTPVFYVVNKIDGLRDEARLYDFHRLGMETLYPISAEHGMGVAELLEAAVRSLPSAEEALSKNPETCPRIAVVGRPNVGKSTLVNTLLGEQRLLTSSEPGTTRDAIDTMVEYRKQKYLFIDTAGLRRRGRVERGVEQFSFSRTLESLERCDLALLLLDGSEGIVDQDTKIAGQILRRGRGCILLVNKWDLLTRKPEAQARVRASLLRHFVFVSHAPALFCSALSQKAVPGIYQLIQKVMEATRRRITTGQLNKFLQDVMQKKAIPSFRGRPVRIYYFTQVKTRPPLFVAFTNKPRGIPPAYRRYLENQLRRTFGFDGVSIQIRFRQKR